MSQTLVAAAKDAPRDADLAFEELYRSSRDDVYAYVAGMLRDRSAAEDVTAAAFERAYRKRARFDPRRGSRAPGCSGSPATPRSTSCAAAAARPSWPPSPPTSAILGRRVGRGERAAARGPRGAGPPRRPRERELIALKFFAGLSNAEIATVLGISETNAGTRLHRAMTKLREACDETA